jgi:adenylate kinase family enzyme
VALNLGRNIVVVGSSCSGKSTLAEEIAGHLCLRFVELDALYWEPEWTHPPVDVFRERVAEATAGDGWAVAGNYSRTLDLIWPRADTIIWLDLSLPLILKRIVQRSWRRSRSDELLWGTNREKFSEHFTTWGDESLIAFAIKNHRRRRRQFAEAMAGDEWPNAKFRRLRSPKMVARFRRAVGLAD